MGWCKFFSVYLEHCLDILILWQTLEETTYGGKGLICSQFPAVSVYLGREGVQTATVTMVSDKIKWERISILTGFLNSHFYAIMAPSQWNVITPIQGRAFFPIILLWRHLCSLPRLFQFTEGESPNQISKFHTYLYSK